MRVVHDRRRSRRTPDALTVEDLLSEQIFDIELVDDEYITDATREPRKFLPPPRMRAKRVATPAREPESRLSKVAKLAGLTTAASLLVGAVVASSVLTRERPEQTSENAPAAPQITGAAALGGFVPGSGGKTPKAGNARPPAPAAVTSSQVPIAETQRAATPASSAPATAASSPPHQPSNSEKLAVVEEFYQRMVSARPEDALAMLTPALAGDEPGDLVRAWSSMSEVDVNEVAVQADGSVRAVVTMLQHDGTKLRITQVLSLAAGTAGIISQAVLLSAEQL
jgi:hypothetical protein